MIAQVFGALPLTWGSQMKLLAPDINLDIAAFLGVSPRMGGAELMLYKHSRNFPEQIIRPFFS